MRTRFLWQALGAVVLTVLITACGGGGGSTPPEGSIQNPISLGIVDGVAIVSDSIPAYGDLFYRFTTGPAGVYTVTISNISNASADLIWDLYADSTYYYENRGYCDNPLPGNVSCDTVSLAANTTYYLVVSEWATEATSYDLAVLSPF